MPRTKKINIGKRKTPNEEKGLSKYKGRGRKSMKEFVDVKIDNSEEVEDEPTIFESQIDNSNTPDINKNDIELLIQKQVQERLEEKLKLLEEKKQKDKEEKMKIKEEAKRVKELEKQERLKKKKEERLATQKQREQEELQRLENEKKIYLKYIEDTIYHRDRTALTQKIGEITSQRVNRIGARIKQ
jgi:chromatin assembly factor 1 subunit A